MTRHLLYHAAFIALAVAASAGLATSARASDPPLAKTLMVQAEAYFQQGNDEFEKQRWSAAEVAYLEAWKIIRTFDVAANLGEVELHLHKMRDAAQHLSYGLRTAPPSSTQAQRERTQHFLDQATEAVGALRLRVNVAGARVELEGNGTTLQIPAQDVPYVVFVEPGTWTVVAKHDGYFEAKETIHAKAGWSQEVELKLLPHSSEHKSKALIATGLGVTGAAIVTGIVFELMAANKGTEAQKKFDEVVNARGPSACDPVDASGCPELQKLLTAKQTLGSVGAWSLIGAGILGAATVSYALISPKKATPAALVVAPVLTGAQRGFLVQGTF